jgi:hypothetical protein
MDMRADSVEVSWDSQKSKWTVEITVGEEVVRRHSDLPRSADDETLRAAAKQTVADEGYDIDPSAISIQRAQAAS